MRAQSNSVSARLSPNLCLMIGLLAFCAAAAPAQTAGLSTAFVYQGQLTWRGGAVDAPADFQFSLWDAVTGGNQIGTDYTINSLPVVASLFSTPIDFGGAAFNGQPRWLQIAVRFTGTLEFVTLAPRQPLLAVPYALQTRGMSVDPNDVIRFTTDPNLVVATMAAAPFSMEVHAPLKVNQQLTVAPPVGALTGLYMLQPADTTFLPLKIRPKTYGTEDPPMRDFNLTLSEPTYTGGTRANRVMTFGYNNNQDGFPESPDSYTLSDRWETNWYINGHNHFERHIQYVSINPGPNYMRAFRPFSIFIDKDDDSIQVDLAGDSVSIDSADGLTQHFNFAGLSMYCVNGSRISFPDAGAKTLISALGTSGSFGDVFAIDSADKITLGSPNIDGGVRIAVGNLDVSAGGATIANDVAIANGNLALQGQGKGLRITEGGGAARMGAVTLAGGMATINTTSVTANSRIFLTSQQDGNGQAGTMRVSGRIPGIAFTINSSRSNDTATVAWLIIEPD